MSNEAASRTMIEYTTPMYAYETVENTDDLVTQVEHIITTRIEHVALVTVSLYFETEGKTISGRLVHTDPKDSIIYFLNSLRPLVRKTDVVLLHGHTLHFLLLAANLQGGQIVQTRLWDALLWRIHNATDGEVVRPYSVTIGHSAYPIPYSDIEEFLEAGNEVNVRSNFALEKTTRKGGGHRTGSQGTMTEEELPTLARRLGVPYLSLLPRRSPERVQQLLNTKLAQELHCYPLGRERNMLTVAMANPQDRSALERLQKETGLSIFPVLTHPHELDTVLEQLV